MEFKLTGTTCKSTCQSAQIPKHYQKLVYPFTDANYVGSSEVDIITQEIAAEGCLISINMIIGKTETIVSAAQNCIAPSLCFMIKGSLEVKVLNQHNWLYQGQFKYLDYDNSNVDFLIKPGKYQYFQIIFSNEFLSKLSAIKIPGSGVITPDIYREFNKILDCLDEKPLLRIRLEAGLRNIIVSLLERLDTRWPKQTHTQKIISTIQAYIDGHLDEVLTVPRLSNNYFLSESSFKSQFKNQIGENFSDYIIRKRMETSKNLIQNTNLPIHQVAMLVGYEEPTNFTREYKKFFKVLPSKERKKSILPNDKLIYPE